MNQPDEEEEDDAGGIDAEDGGQNSQEEHGLLPDVQFQLNAPNLEGALNNEAQPINNQIEENKQVEEEKENQFLQPALNLPANDQIEEQKEEQKDD